MGANATTFVPAYVSGEVLTAADLTVTNSGIPVFADSTARAAAFGGSGEKVLAEGQFAYLESDNTTYYYDSASWVAVGGGASIAVFNETQANGTTGGAGATGSFQKRTLNTTLVNNITGCSIASSVITLPAGTYNVIANQPFYASNKTISRFYNTSDSASAINGTGVEIPSSQNNLPLIGAFTITASKNFELQYQITSTAGSSTLGLVFFSEPAIFASISIIKVA
jgi:hypothetical protein